MADKGKLVVFSGFSGAGKGTIMKELMKKFGSDYALSISATTRNPRPGEEHGREYFFVTTDEFEDMIQKGELLEYAKYVSNYYGTPRSYVEEQLNAGKNVILEIEIQGALKIKQRFPDTLLMFVCAPSADELKNRLVGRGTESEDVCRQRLSLCSGKFLFVCFSSFYHRDCKIFLTEIGVEIEHLYCTCLCFLGCGMNCMSFLP